MLNSRDKAKLPKTFEILTMVVQDFFLLIQKKLWPCIPLQRVLKKVAIDAAKGQLVLLLFTQAIQQPLTN